MAKKKQQPGTDVPETGQDQAGSDYHIPVLLHETISGLSILNPVLFTWTARLAGAVTQKLSFRI